MYFFWLLTVVSDVWSDKKAKKKKNIFLLTLEFWIWLHSVFMFPFWRFMQIRAYFYIDNGAFEYLKHKIKKITLQNNCLKGVD